MGHERSWDASTSATQHEFSSLWGCPDSWTALNLVETLLTLLSTGDLKGYGYISKDAVLEL